MSKFCTSCGSPLQDGDLICSNCGATVQTEASAQPVPMTVPYTPPQTTMLNGEPAGETVSLWAYLGMIVLFLLPCVGFIAALVMSFVPKNKNIKNFARAAVIWMVVFGLFFSLIGVLIGAAITKAITFVFSELDDLTEESDVVSEDGKSVDLHALFDAILEKLEEQGLAEDGILSIDEVSAPA